MQQAYVPLDDTTPLQPGHSHERHNSAYKLFCGCSKTTKYLAYGALLVVLIAFVTGFIFYAYLGPSVPALDCAPTDFACYSSFVRNPKKKCDFFITVIDFKMAFIRSLIFLLNMKFKDLSLTFLNLKKLKVESLLLPKSRGRTVS